MIGAVIVGTAADGDGQPERAVIRHDQKVRPRLGSAVRAGRVNGRLLRKKQIGPVERKIAIHLIGGYLMIAADAVFAAGVHQRLGAEDVGLQKDARIFNGAVDMALCGKIDDIVELLRLKEGKHKLSVADVSVHELEIGFIHDGRERLQIARVSERIQADERILRIAVHHIMAEVSADKSGAAGHKIFTHEFPPIVLIFFVLHAESPNGSLPVFSFYSSQIIKS